MMMHRQWMDGHGHPWLWLFGSLAVILLWGGAIWAIVGLFNRGGSGPSAPTGAGTSAGSPLASAEQILAERLARGEIDTEEYRTRRNALYPAPPPTP